MRAVKPAPDSTAARIIVNEGDGPEQHPLAAAECVIGAEASSDVRLVHPSAAGTVIVLSRTAGGHSVRVVRGRALHNEARITDVVHLLHKDTLRIGESLVLYKNEAARIEPEPATPAVDAVDAFEACEDLQAALPVPPAPPAAGSTPDDPIPLEPVEAVASAPPARAEAPPPSPAPRALPGPASPTRSSPARRRSAGPIRFAKPLPKGCRAPSGPPPAHPPR